ncbi:MAG TPA: hypothetical protein VMS76_13525 [Planctomycetota bacterium]|nr:hypothetical protein [Planctomycetota bacterium]
MGFLPPIVCRRFRRALAPLRAPPGRAPRRREALIISETGAPQVAGRLAPAAARAGAGAGARSRRIDPHRGVEFRPGLYRGDLGLDGVAGRSQARDCLPGALRVTARLGVVVRSLAVALRPDRDLRVSLGALAKVASGLLLGALVVGVRLYRLEDIPGEWYGDISTLYEYSLRASNGDFPKGLYILGVGPLYPLALAPLLSLLGTRYLTIKLVAVLWSLAGLAALYLFCRRLQGPGFGAIAVAVAGTGSWLLIFSRLGDLHAAVPFVVMASLALAAKVVTTPSGGALAALACGVVTGASGYLHGAAFAVPVLVTAMLLAFQLARRPRLPARNLLLYALALAATLAPMALDYLGSPDALGGSHFAARLVRGESASSHLASNLATALAAYVTRGDPVYRFNPPQLPHLDRASLALAVLGCIFWLMPGRRRWGAVLVGGFLLMHLPMALARESDPSAPRTIGAAPLAYVLTASGIWWLGSLARRRHRIAGSALVAALLLLVVSLNLRRFFVLYEATLPYENTPLARAITAYVDMLPPGTAVHLVGSTWAPGFMPEPKSIRYTMRQPRTLLEEIVERFDCQRLARIQRPAVLIWMHQSPTPSPRTAACSADLAPQLYSSSRGLPLFHAATLGAARPLPTDHDERTWPADQGLTAAGEGSLPPVDTWRSAGIELAGRPVEILHLPLDMGAPQNIVDGDLSTPMRGARDNPYAFELRYAEPTPIERLVLHLGHMPEYRVEALITRPDAEPTTVTVHDRPQPGVPVVELAVPGAPVLATSVRITIFDIRPTPAEGWHIHVFELEQR